MHRHSHTNFPNGIFELISPFLIPTGHACERSCGASAGYMQYKDGDKVMQLKHFTPLYLTSSPVYTDGFGNDCNGISGLNNTQANGSALFPQPSNGLRYQNSLAIESTSDLASSVNFNDGSFDNAEIDMGGGVIASKSSGSVTKFSTRQTNGTLSRKPSSGEDRDSVYLISGSSMDQPTMGIDLNSSTQCLSEEKPNGHIPIPVPIPDDGEGYFEYGENGEMYACHYV